jgi:hypothetical protein
MRRGARREESIGNKGAQRRWKGVAVSPVGARWLARREYGREGKEESTGRRRGNVGFQKRPRAKTGALPDRTREPKPETDFPATTFTNVKPDLGAGSR